MCDNDNDRYCTKNNINNNKNLDLASQVASIVNEFRERRAYT